MEFWQTRTGLFVQVIVVLIPSVILLNSGYLLLVGLLAGVLFASLGLKLQQQTWKSVGLRRPSTLLNTFLIVFFWIIALIIISFLLRHLITSLIHKGPDLGAFKSVKGNFTALLMGLAVAWIFGGFCEEMFFRGFLMNVIYKIMPGSAKKSNIKWGLALVITSILTGFGHSYQGITGMIVTGIIALCFGLIYLTNRRNLWPGILTHGIYDSVAFILLFSGFSFDSLFKF